MLNYVSRCNLSVAKVWVNTVSQREDGGEMSEENVKHDWSDENIQANHIGIAKWITGHKTTSPCMSFNQNLIKGKPCLTNKLYRKVDNEFAIWYHPDDSTSWRARLWLMPRPVVEDIPINRPSNTCVPGVLGCVKLEFNHVSVPNVSLSRNMST